MRGHTLLELLFVLTLITVGASAFVPSARRLRDRAAATATREALVAGFADARTSARRHGGAQLILRRTPPSYRVDTPGRQGEWAFPAETAAVLRLDSGRDSIVVDYDRMGVGRFASHSIEVEVGRVARRLVVSSYGRIRRR